MSFSFSSVILKLVHKYDQSKKCTVRGGGRKAMNQDSDYTTVTTSGKCSEMWNELFHGSFKLVFL